MVRQSESGKPGRIVLAAASTVVGVAMLFGYSTSTGGHVGSSSVVVASGSAGTTGPSGTTSRSGGTAATGTTYDGSVAQTRWGPVQVQITVSGGKLVGATVLQVPNGNGRDQQINAYAVPILNDETVQAGSAQIDTVSGATVTSLGYIESLQAALDTAHLS